MKKAKYIVREQDLKSWGSGRWNKKGIRFSMIRNGELLFTMESSSLMEPIVRSRFNELAERLNKQPLSADC